MQLERQVDEARPTQSMSAPIGQLIAGKYLVERVLGEGGMGVVLAAHQRALDRRVAIKLLRPELAAVGMAAERFRREARAAASIRGEHVCQILDVGTLDSGVPFMVMEYLEGNDLAAELERRGPLPFAEAVTYVCQACQAVGAAHAQGVIHRDLKPANLFLEGRADGSRRIKVLDFGVSKSLLDTHSGGLTQTSSLLGSPLYMSPEQLDSAKNVDARTDVWALGVVLYELISGQMPFDGESIPQLVTAVLQATPRDLRELVPELPAALQHAVMRALSRTRAARFASVSELAQAIAPFAAYRSAPPHLRSLLPCARESQPSAAERSSGFGDETSTGHGGGPRGPRWLWWSLVGLGLLALLAREQLSSGALPQRAESATMPPLAAGPSESAAQLAEPDSRPPPLTAARTNALNGVPEADVDALPAIPSVAGAPPPAAAPEPRVSVEQPELGAAREQDAARAAVARPELGRRRAGGPARVSRNAPISDFGGRR